MPVMKVRAVRVGVLDRRVLVPMRVPGANGPVRVEMVVMPVVIPVPVLVADRLVPMGVDMAFALDQCQHALHEGASDDLGGENKRVSQARSTPQYDAVATTPAPRSRRLLSARDIEHDGGAIRGRADAEHGDYVPRSWARVSATT